MTWLTGRAAAALAAALVTLAVEHGVLTQACADQAGPAVEAEALGVLQLVLRLFGL